MVPHGVVMAVFMGYAGEATSPSATFPRAALGWFPAAPATYGAQAIRGAYSIWCIEVNHGDPTHKRRRFTFELSC